jgi:hypothetical protein
MKKILTAGLITAGCLSPAFADEVGDPNALLTHGLSAGVSFFTMSDEESQAFTPASAYSECIHAEIGETYCARIAAADECSNIDEDVDIVRFEWSNLNLSYPQFGVTAAGSAISTISTTMDAEVSLGSIENLGDLSSQADWSVELHSDAGLIGSFSDIDASFQIEKDTRYELVFSIGGYDTLTTNGNMVSWNMAIAYASSGGAVPGAGGIAAFAGLAAGRRRRRR